MTQNKFPTEIIDLPSKGYFYPEDNPLTSGKIEMRYMTARDEDILTSSNLIQQGKALDKLLESLIVDKTIDYNDILVGDKNAILVGARVLAYGKNYDFSFIDEYGEQVKGIADLTKLVPQNYDFSNYEKGINSFSYTLPKTERIITFSIPTHQDEISMDIEVEAIKKVFKNDKEAISRENSTRLKYLIKSVDGKTDRKSINEFVDNEFLSVDSLAFRNYVAETSPNLDFRIEVENSRGEKEKVVVPMTAQFFGLTPDYKKDLHEQIFQIIFYAKGGFTFDEVYDLPVYLRRFYYKRLVQQYEQEKQQQEQQIKKSNNRFK